MIDYNKDISIINELNNNYTAFELLDESSKTEEPWLYHIMVHNDDYTPMEFVVDFLQKHFSMDRYKATDTMLEAHIKGKAPCGIFTKDVAESKLLQAADFARMHKHPLVCSMEAAT